MNRDELIQIILGHGQLSEGALADAILAEIEKLRAENEALRAKLAEREAVIDAVAAVAYESEGIAGWHKNGDIARWEEILPEIFTDATEQEPAK